VSTLREYRPDQARITANGEPVRTASSGNPLPWVRRWDTMTPEEIVEDIRAVASVIPDEARTVETVVLLSTETAISDAAIAMAEAPLRLRRTRVGRWVIDGRTYRTKRLALASVHARIVEPLWSVLIRPVSPDEYRYSALLPGTLRRVVVHGKIVV